MRTEDFDYAVIDLARRLTASGVEYVVLEDDDDVALTIVPGPSQRNLERLTRALKRAEARMDVPGHRLDYDEMFHGRPGQWPIVVGGVTIDVVVVGVADGRWSAYYDKARRLELQPGLALDVVPGEPVIRVRRRAARVMQH